ncbi:MAG TPA: hypothetical protein PK765_02815 [bacterium]|nr:hypothetical protein [bacterium]
MYWLETIQYVGTHAVGAEYRAYLATLLELVTDIDPRMVDAYIFGQTLLPRELDEYQGEDRHLNEAIGLGEK